MFFPQCFFGCFLSTRTAPTRISSSCLECDFRNASYGGGLTCVLTGSAWKTTRAARAHVVGLPLPSTGSPQQQHGTSVRQHFFDSRSLPGRCTKTLCSHRTHSRMHTGRKARGAEKNDMGIYSSARSLFVTFLTPGCTPHHGHAKRTILPRVERNRGLHGRAGTTT